MRDAPDFAEAVNSAISALAALDAAMARYAAALADERQEQQSDAAIDGDDE